MGIFSKIFTKEESGQSQGSFWHHINSVDDITSLCELSKSKAVFIFKHSTRCSISSVAMNRIEKSWDFKEDEAIIFFLDLIALRSVSNEIAEHFSVDHQSPQLLLIKDGQCVYHASHMNIELMEAKEFF